MIIFIYLYISGFIKYAHHPLWVILQNSYHKELELNWCISLPNLSQEYHVVPLCNQNILNLSGSREIKLCMRELSWISYPERKKLQSLELHFPKDLSSSEEQQDGEISTLAGIWYRFGHHRLRKTHVIDPHPQWCWKSTEFQTKTWLISCLHLRIILDFIS